MLRPNRAIGIAVFIIAACASTPPGGSRETTDQQFEALAAKFIDQYLEMNPETATGLGDHRFDDRLNDRTLDGVNRDRQLHQRYLQLLKAIPLSQLNIANQVDYRILLNRLEYRLFEIDVLREHSWNPLRYNAGGAIHDLLARDFAPLRDRLLSVRDRLDQMSQTVSAAKQALQSPPRVHTETAIGQNKGVIHLVREELQAFIDQVPGMEKELAPARRKALVALEDYQGWLEGVLLPKSTGDFRLGDEKFRAKLRFSLNSDLSKEKILEQAMVDLRSTQEELYRAALPLHAAYFSSKISGNEDKKAVIRAVLHKLADAHPNNETIVPLASQYLQSAIDFVRAKDFITVPAKPVKVIVMPEFKRGVAVAYCDAAGPLERNGETFYAISPTPSDWTPARTTSFFREYNNAMVQEVTIHEAVPGHYLQLAHSNQFVGPTRIRSIFRSGSFAEGWAVYSEALMAEHGYGGAEVKMQQLKMRLRMIINAILDQKVHTEAMTEKEAMALMTDDGFQEEGEAAGKWRRAALSSAQLSTYYVGDLEVEGIRQAYEAKHGAKVDYKKLHDTMLSFGTPSPKYVKELMGL
jgi:uncharacterized protein (DUF885 family)